MAAALKHFCARHNHRYAALDTCQQCEADPGPAPDDTGDDEPVVFPEGIPHPNDQLRRLNKRIDQLDEVAAALWEKGTMIDPHVANSYIKAIDTILKHERLLMESGLKRCDEVLVARRHKQIAKGQRRGGSH